LRLSKRAARARLQSADQVLLILNMWLAGFHEQQSSGRSVTFSLLAGSESAVARAKLRANAQSSWSHRDFDGL
jgi:hypothetical protein